MLTAQRFLSRLADLGVGGISGVPCSYLAALFSHLDSGRWPYVSATSEGEAVALAAGTWLGGGQGMALCQNSGLGNAVNPLSSLTAPFEIPLLLGVSRRGWPRGTDEPQHAVMGAVTPALLALLGLDPVVLDDDPAAAQAQLRRAVERTAARRSTALVLPRGVVAGPPHAGPAAPTGDAPGPAAPAGAGPAEVRRLSGGPAATRSDVLGMHLELAAGRATVATTGYTGRELYALDDRDEHFYMVGSMGWAAAIGVGFSAAAGRPVTVVDGDGALLMHLGSLATVARAARAPFLHLVLDNGMHESTGGQRTHSDRVDFAAAAAACGYRAAWSCAGADGARTALTEALATSAGPVLVHCRIAPGVSRPPPRPTVPLPELALRFRHSADRAAIH